MSTDYIEKIALIILGTMISVIPTLIIAERNSQHSLRQFIFTQKLEVIRDLSRAFYNCTAQIELSIGRIEQVCEPLQSVSTDQMKNLSDEQRTRLATFLWGEINNIRAKVLQSLGEID